MALPAENIWERDNGRLGGRCEEVGVAIGLGDRQSVRDSIAALVTGHALTRCMGRVVHRTAPDRPDLIKDLR